MSHLRKGEDAILAAMRDRKPRRKVARFEPDFVAEETHITVDKPLPKANQADDVAELRELKFD